MPVIGPDYNKELANKATKDVIEFLKSKYKIRSMEPTLDEIEIRDDDDEELQRIIHKFFLHECWEGF